MAVRVWKGEMERTAEKLIAAQSMTFQSILRIIAWMNVWLDKHKLEFKKIKQLTLSSLNVHLAFGSKRCKFSYSFFGQ